MRASTGQVKFSWLGWVWAAFFAFFTVATVRAGAGWKTALAGSVLLVLVAPPARQWLYNKTRLVLRRWALVIPCFIVFMGQLALMVDEGTESERREELAKQKASAERVAKVRADTLTFYDANKVAVLGEVATLVEQGKPGEAMQLVSKYASVSKDPDLARAKRIVEVEDARAQLRSDGANMPLSKRVALYKVVAEHEPDNTLVVATHKRLAEQLEKQEAAERAAKHKAEVFAARKKQIESKFHSWDGSHTTVERAVKATMKNPDSYQHVETRYVDTGSTILVTTTIRGTNSFNAVVPTTFVAEVDINGNLLSLTTVR
jgi:hypothetical protein